jgi:outer membrane protein OmpA-like peptidoglycan-associated protein
VTSDAGDLSSEGPKTYQIPDYSRLSNNFVDTNSYGINEQDYPNHQRYTYLNIDQRNKPNYTGDVKLRNVVTTAVVQQKVENVPSEQIEQKGGLYFEHGFDKFTPKDIVTAPGYENVHIDQIADALVHNQAFELKMTAHADTSGSASQNQTLSEHRLDTAKALLLAALQRQGLTADEANILYEKRVEPHASILALGETQEPVTTADGIKDQGNRVVTFDLITNAGPRQYVTTSVTKPQDFDNHEHTVILNLGTSNKQKELHFYPENDDIVEPGQFAIADENTNFVLKIDPERKDPFTINYWAHTNRIADNTNFLIESDRPGAVTSAYNFKTGAIDVSQNGRIVANIVTLNKIDPASIRIGQITSEGEASISPLTNLAEVAPISESRHAGAERNALTNAADRIVQISIDAKHLYMAHPNDTAGYQKALGEYGFSSKIDDAFKDLDKIGINTGPYKSLLMNSYTNPQSASYNPDQVVFPFQTFQGLYESEVSRGALKNKDRPDAYKELLDEINRAALSNSDPVKKPAPIPSLQNN